MANPATPANAGHDQRRALDRNAKHGLKIYTDQHTAVPYFDAAHTPTTIHHPDHATVGLVELFGRLEAALGDRRYDLLTGENFCRDRVTEVNHIAHTNLIPFINFWRVSKAFGYNLHPHSTCNTLLSMSNNHVQFGKLHEALCLTQEDWETFLSLVTENLQRIDDGKPANNLFNHPFFKKGKTWTLEYLCLDRESSLFTFFKENLERITDQRLTGPRAVPMPAHGYTMREVLASPAYVFLSQTFALDKWDPIGDTEGKSESFDELPLTKAHRQRVKEMHEFAVKKIGLFKDMTAEEYNQLKFEGLDPKTKEGFRKAMGDNYTDGPMPLTVDTGKKDTNGNKIMKQVFITFDPHAPPVGVRKYLPTAPLEGPYAPATPSRPADTAGRPRDLEFYLADENSKDSFNTSAEFDPEKDGQPAAQTTGTKLRFSEFALLNDAVEEHAKALARGFEDLVTVPDSPASVGRPHLSSASDSSSHHHDPIPPPVVPSPPFNGLSKRRRVTSPPSSHLDDDDNDNDNPFRTTRPPRAEPSKSRAPLPKKPRRVSPSPPPRRPAPVASSKPRRKPKNTDQSRAGRRAATSGAQHSIPSAEPLGVAGPGPSTMSRQAGNRQPIEPNESPVPTMSAPRRSVRTPTVQPTASSPSTVHNFARPTAASLARVAVPAEGERRPTPRSRSSTSQQPPKPRRGPAGGAPKK